MDYIELRIIALANSQSSPGNYVIVLQELPFGRKLPIIIGGFEAQAIAVAIEKVEPARPLTHDLYKHTLNAFDAIITHVCISRFEQGIFYATLFCERADGSMLEIDSRASDAIAIALKYHCPIYTLAAVLDKAGLYTENSNGVTDPQAEPESLDTFSIEELESMMEELLDQEEYEQAAKIRDAMERKNNDLE